MKWKKKEVKNEMVKVRMKINDMEVKDESEVRDVVKIIFSLNVDTYSYEI